VIVVNIPRSDIAPHQAVRKGGSKKYYRRSNSRVREMEHGEIEDLFFARKRPKLRIELRRCPTESPSYDIVIHNDGKVLAEKIFIKLLIPGVFKVSHSDWPKIKDGFTSRGSSYSEYQYFGNEFIYPELPSTIGKLFHPEKHYVDFLEVGFLIVCDGMGLERGKIVLGDERGLEIIYSQESGVPFPDWKLKGEFYILPEYYQ